MVRLRTSQELTTGWSVKQTDNPSEDAWLPVLQVPTNVHLDLLANRKIPDPFVGFNELLVEWVGEKAWTYRVDLPARSQLAGALDGASVALVFEGLDTFARVRLNGETILESDNMFVPHRVDITHRLREENRLEIDFDSALLRAREIQKIHPDHKWVGFNGEPARFAVRKAQYHWGWDWGPVLMTAGPWRPVRLEVFHSRIAVLRVKYQVATGLDVVSGTIFAKVEGQAGRTVAFSIASEDRTLFEGTSVVNEDGVAEIAFDLQQPSLWYPHGYGPQPIYEVSAVLTNNGIKLDKSVKNTGFRLAQLVQERDDVGQSFYFRINGVDVFCGGSNWIPADSFLPTVSAGRYRKWLQSMVQGNQVMVRIWGGGIYEEDVFYDICDQLGILVWQDFMFACGIYPAFPSFLDSVRKEAIANVRRLRHHPSIVIYAGNNEDYAVQEHCNLEYDFPQKDPQQWLQSRFPARYIYEKLLPEVIQEECPEAFYHPGSPWGDGRITSDPSHGDMHQWNVWHGTQEKYQVYGKLGGRFNSEFGMEAFPHLETIKYFVTDTAELYPQSRMLDFHNKADGHERRIGTYLVENFRTKTDLKEYIYLTQLMQAEAMLYGYRDWRRQWGEKRFCGGALVWQLNDCWPGMSWAIMDYFLRRKASFYTMARTLAPLAVAVKREHHDWSVCHARPAKASSFKLWVASSKPTEIMATVELRFISIDSGRDLKPAIIKHDIPLTANGTMEILDGVIDNVYEEPHVLAARLFVDGNIVSRDVDWPQPYKYLSLRDRGVEMSAPIQEDECLHTLRVSAERPTKALVFDEHDDVVLSDNVLDVIPGDEQVVRVSGMTADCFPLGYMYLGM